jgi:hypothetical protein
MEGSTYTGKGTSTDSCNMGITAGNEPPNICRRYVIDASRGRRLGIFILWLSFRVREWLGRAIEGGFGFKA